jgi:hypothetical protein
MGTAAGDMIPGDKAMPSFDTIGRNFDRPDLGILSFRPQTIQLPRKNDDNIAGARSTSYVYYVLVGAILCTISANPIFIDGAM